MKDLQKHFLKFGDFVVFRSDENNAFIYGDG